MLENGPGQAGRHSGMPKARSAAGQNGRATLWNAEGTLPCGGQNGCLCLNPDRFFLALEDPVKTKGEGETSASGNVLGTVLYSLRLSYNGDLNLRALGDIIMLLG